jgi:uncharacterized protein
MNSAFLDTYKTEMENLCKKHGVLQLHAFGSVLRSDFSPQSDVDFLVNFRRDAYTNAFNQYFEFKEALESLLHRNVDLVVEKNFRNPIFKAEVEQTKRSIYAA